MKTASHWVLSARSAVHSYVASHHRPQVSCGGGECRPRGRRHGNGERESQLGSGAGPWQHRVSSARRQISMLSHVRCCPGHFSHQRRRETFCHLAMCFQLSDKSEDIAQMKARITHVRVSVKNPFLVLGDSSKPAGLYHKPHKCSKARGQYEDRVVVPANPLSWTTCLVFCFPDLNL